MSRNVWRTGLHLLHICATWNNNHICCLCQTANTYTWCCSTMICAVSSEQCALCCFVGPKWESGHELKWKIKKKRCIDFYWELNYCRHGRSFFKRQFVHHTIYTYNIQQEEIAGALKHELSMPMHRARKEYNEKKTERWTNRQQCGRLSCACSFEWANMPNAMYIQRMFSNVYYIETTRMNCKKMSIRRHVGIFIVCDEKYIYTICIPCIWVYLFISRQWTNIYKNGHRR